MDREILSSFSSSFAEEESSVPILTLRSWKGLFIEPSSFVHASISPAWDTLLLLSRYSEAFLFSLTKTASEADSERCDNEVQFSDSSESPPSPSSPIDQNFYTPQTSRKLTPLNSLESTPYFTPLRTPSPFQSPLRSPPRDSGCGDSIFLPAIADVRSCVWGCCGDGCSSDIRAERSGFFRQLLFVLTGNRKIFVHGFCNTVEDSYASEGNGRLVHWRPGGPVDVDEKLNNSFSKNWLQSTLADLKLEERDSQLNFRFPSVFSGFSSSQVVSFMIDCNSSLFIQFIAGKTNTNGSYEASRLISSPTGTLVGIVLSSDGFERFVTIADVCDWGISLVFSVDLSNEALNLRPGISWSDFQLSNEVLFGLTEPGVIFMWSANDGKFLSCMDVMHFNGLRREPYAFTRESDQEKTYCHFKSLLVTADSLLIGAVDKRGSVHVVSADEYSSSSHTVLKDSITPLQRLSCSDLDVLSIWDVAGSNIGCQKSLFGIPNRCWLKSFGKEAGQEGKSNGFVKLSSADEGLLSNRSTTPDGLNIRQHKKLKPLRRIFLPSRQFDGNLVVALSSYGITKFLPPSPPNSSLKEFEIAHIPLRLQGRIFQHGTYVDDRNLARYTHGSKIKRVEGDTLGFSHQGCLYLVSKSALHVVLPPLSSSLLAPKSTDCSGSNGTDIVDTLDANVKASFIERNNVSFQMQWQIEVLDRALVYDGPRIAEDLSAENGWSVTQTRLRWLQIALDYLRFEDVERALEALTLVDAAEDGVLRVLFFVVDLIFNKSRSDNELTQALKMVVLAARFATKMVCYYGKLDWTEKSTSVQIQNSDSDSYFELLPVSDKRDYEKDTSRKLHEMACYLEVSRHLQDCIKGKLAPNQRDIGDDLSAVPFDKLKTSKVQSISDTIRDEMAQDLKPETSCPDDNEELIPASNESEELALSPLDYVASSSGYMEPGIFRELAVSRMSQQGTGKRIHPLENPEDMVKRWEVDQLDLTSIVKDALRTGRLPLAVLQFHRLHSSDSTKHKGPHDAFREVQKVGKAIVYELFCKGKTALAVAALQRLGEDIETSLKELAFGTVSRYLRANVSQELKRFSYLRPYDIMILERVSLLERLYPSSSFWSTYDNHQLLLPNNDYNKHDRQQLGLQLGCSSQLFGDLSIECGEIDGVVVGSWSDITSSGCLVPSETQDNHSAGYWAGAACWLEALDQIAIDRVVLDQPLFMGVHVSWESQFEYYVAHNDFEELTELLETIPPSVLREGTLQVQLDFCEKNGNTEFFEKHSEQIVDSVEIIIPKVKLFKLQIGKGCAVSLKSFIEKQLAKRFIFLKACWRGTQEIMSLLGQTSFFSRQVTNMSLRSSPEEASEIGLSYVHHGEVHSETMQAIHVLVLRYCMQFELPHLLDIYLDHYGLGFDASSLSLMRAIAAVNQWAQLLLLTRIKGYEYDASFCNARLNLSRNSHPSEDKNTLESLIPTVDDMAEGGGEMAALATLMYVSVPFQKCLCMGSINRQRRISFQCTLENLRPALQHFPTLWQSLVAVCFGHDPCSIPSAQSWKISNSTIHKYHLAEYIKSRECIFSSAGGDTSLVLMMPQWFPKSVRRLLQLYVQGPVTGNMLGDMLVSEIFTSRKTSFHSGNDAGDADDALSWEVALQRNIEEELYASSFEEDEFGVEHYLYRGRPIAAFNSLLENRAQKIMSLERNHEQIHRVLKGQIQEIHMMLASMSPEEEKLLVSVMLLAIIHFDNDVLVASCTSLLELCGLSASLLLLDVAALHRISVRYKHHVAYENSDLTTSSTEVNAAASLAQKLADEYANFGVAFLVDKKSQSSAKPLASSRPSRVLLALLRHLEEASLPEVARGQTPGSWLLTGEGDVSQLRFQQRSASEHWCLVTTFCQAHHLPISTVYLARLARDNDWVGFLAEAQFEGCPIDTAISVASKEFTDARLRSHVLTVLKSIQSPKQTIISLDTPSVVDQITDGLLSPMDTTNELFRLLAESEKERQPGRKLLAKAKDLRWSLLAVIASCFQDVSAFSCLTVWLEITAARETSSIKVDNVMTRIAAGVGAAVEANNAFPDLSKYQSFQYNRKNPKRRRIMEQPSATSCPENAAERPVCNNTRHSDFSHDFSSQATDVEGKEMKQSFETVMSESEVNDEQASLCRMIGVLCKQHLFLPLLKAFDLFLPTCSLLSFIRFLQAFSHMRLSEASAHITSFSAQLRDEIQQKHATSIKSQKSGTWVISVALKAADAVLSTCPSPYERQCLLKLLASAEFGDGGTAAAHFRRLYWKTQLAEPYLRQGADLVLECADLDDAALLTELENRGYWEEARSWATQLESIGPEWKSAVHHVTERQAEAMVLEWKEFLWDVPEEQTALWGHCQDLFVKYSFPPLQAGMFFLKHAHAIEKHVSASELHRVLLLALQWLSGMITKSEPVYPLHLLREIESRVWLLAVESEAESKDLEGVHQSSMILNSGPQSVQGSHMGNNSAVIDYTASTIAKMDAHLNSIKARSFNMNDKQEAKKMEIFNVQTVDSVAPGSPSFSGKQKRRSRAAHKRATTDIAEKEPHKTDENHFFPLPSFSGNEHEMPVETGGNDPGIETPLSGWEERVGVVELERAVLALLEVGQISAAKQLQQKLSPTHAPPELMIIEEALNCAESSSMCARNDMSMSNAKYSEENNLSTSFQVLEELTTKCREGCGKGLCKRIIAIVKIANFLELSFTEAFQKQPIELLQLLSLNAQDSFEEAKILCETNPMPAASIAKILAESFLKGLLAAHRGGYLGSSQREEGPAPLLWRSSDFLKWAELCPSQPELGHALMRIVIAGQDIPHACEVELLILAHHFYKSSACLDGVDVLVALAATRVESYVAERDFSCLARLVTGINNFHALHFMLDILIENGQLELLLKNYTVTDATTDSAGAVRGFRMSVLSALKHFNSNDLDAFAMVYNHFGMKHEMSALLESRAHNALQFWLLQHDKERSEELLEMMRFYVEAAEVYSSIDAGNKTRWSCAQASLVSLQIRMPDINWLNLSETQARRVLVEQSRFQEALTVAEAYNLNQSGEWALVIWNQMLWPDLVDRFLTEFVSVLPLPSTMLMEIARFYRAEVTARGDQSHFTTWLAPAGLPHEWARNLGKSFRSLLKQTRDVRLRIQLATTATGFPDVIDSCMQILDKVPETAGPLILRKGHGGGYLRLM